VPELHAPGRTGSGGGECGVDAGDSSTVVLVGGAVAIEERVEELEDHLPGVGGSAWRRWKRRQTRTSTSTGSDGRGPAPRRSSIDTESALASAGKRWAGGRSDSRPSRPSGPRVV
jgi:hypothetical protein